MASLATISSTTTGIAGVVMAVPQLTSLLPGQKSAQNTIGYQPTLQNGNSVNPPSLIFDYEGEQSVELKSDITDHWAEDNLTLQNQIALRPIRINTRGFIGELTNRPPNAVLAALQVAANKLTLVPGMTPALSPQALNAYNQAAFAYQTGVNAANAAVTAFSTLTSGLQGTGEAVVSNQGITNTSSLNAFGVGTQSRQQIYFQQFYGYWFNRTLFTVQTPWAVFTNMVIETLRPQQDEDTNTVTTFEVTFKQLRFATTGSSLNLANVQANQLTRLFSQTSANVNFASSNLTQIVSQPAVPTDFPSNVGVA